MTPRRVPRASWWVLGGAAYLAYAAASLQIDWGRAAKGVARGAAFAAALLHPDFASRWGEILEGLGESLAMTVLATAAGTLLSVPVAFGAARNISPLPVYLACRAVVVLARSFHELIVAIFFVVLVGFGPLAGVLTLAFATVGFTGKLLAEAIEEVAGAPVEALRSAGAGPLQVIRFAIVPQVVPRFVGLTAYRLDINFRESAIIGVVGAGGIGATLNTAFDRYEYGVAGAILLTIVALVLAGETLSGAARRRLS